MSELSSAQLLSPSSLKRLRAPRHGGFAAETQNMEIAALASEAPGEGREPGVLSSALPNQGHAVLVPKQGLGCLELGSQCFPHSWPVQDTRGSVWRVGVKEKSSKKRRERNKKAHIFWHKDVF